MQETYLHYREDNVSKGRTNEIRAMNTLTEKSSEVTREHKLAATLLWHDARAWVMIDIPAECHVNYIKPLSEVASICWRCYFILWYHVKTAVTNSFSTTFNFVVNRTSWIEVHTFPITSSTGLGFVQALSRLFSFSAVQCFRKPQFRKTKNPPTSDI